jgi:hypothetical protein
MTEGINKISAKLPCAGTVNNQKEGNNAKVEMYDLPVYL